MFDSDFKSAIMQIAEEKNIPFEKVIETIEAALAAAYRKDFGEPNQNIQVKFDAETGGIKVADVKEVVEEIPEMPEVEEGEERLEPAKPAEEGAEPEEEEVVYNVKEHIALADAKKIKKGAKIGDVISQDITPAESFGRIAAQTAKQVIIQRLREAEREILSEEFKDKEGELVNGSVQRIEGRNVFVNLGPATGVIFPREQIRGERFNVGQNIKVYISEVKETPKGPEIVISRTHPKFVEKLFELEVPEIAAGTVKVKGVAREPGSRTKIALWSDEEGVDPVGAGVGQRGTRVQTIINELNGEKIDIIEWNEDVEDFIKNALAPAKVVKIDLNEEGNEAKVEVEEDQLSLAIGREGQNVRLAAKLTGWKIDIVASESKAGADKKDEEKEEKSDEKAEDKKEEAKEEKKTEKKEEKSEKKSEKTEKKKVKKEEESDAAEADDKEDKKE